MWLTSLVQVHAQLPLLLAGSRTGSLTINDVVLDDAGQPSLQLRAGTHLGDQISSLVWRSEHEALFASCTLGGAEPGTIKVRDGWSMA